MASQKKRVPVSRRQFLRTTLGASASALFLSACGSSPTTSGQSGATPSSAPAASGGGQQVRALMWSNGPLIDANFQKRVELFNQAHTGNIQVDLQLLPYDQYWSRIDLSYASRTPYDIYFWDVQAYGHYKAGLLANLQPFVDAAPELMNSDQYPTELYNNWRFDGTNLYALPENFQTMALFYNKQLFDEAGIEPPDDTWTWERAVEVARQLTNTENNQWGMSLGGMGGAWWGAQTLAWAMGGSFVDKPVEPTRFQMSDPVNIQALKFLQDLIWVEKVAPNAEQAAATAQDSNIFQSGKVAMVPDGSWLISGFSEVDFEWGIAPLPKWNDTSVAPFWFGGWVIPQASQVQQAAFEFARWSATDYQPTMAADRDWIPIQREARESLTEQETMPAGMDQALAAISSARLGDIYHRNGQKILAEVLGPTLQQLFNNAITPEAAAREIDEKANPLLQEA
jgi:multiple sugar transport system substrate-binding protein